MPDDEFQELTEKPAVKQKAIIEVDDNWPFWQRFAANVVNVSPIFVWIIVGFLMMWFFAGNPELVGFRNAYLNLVIPATMWGVGSLISGVALFALLFPYFNFRAIMKNGTPLEKAMCMGLYGAIAIALAIVIASVA